MARCVHCDVYMKTGLHFNGGGALCANCYKVRIEFAIKQGKAMGIEPEGSTMKRGEVREIPASGSYQRQWECQGSARQPYRVSLTKSGIFQCGCPAGRTTPGGMTADPCKHVLLIQTKTGAGLPQWTTIGVIHNNEVTRANGETFSTNDMNLKGAEVPVTRRRFR